MNFSNSPKDSLNILIREKFSYFLLYDSSAAACHRAALSVYMDSGAGSYHEQKKNHNRFFKRPHFLSFSVTRLTLRTKFPRRPGRTV